MKKLTWALLIAAGLATSARAQENSDIPAAPVEGRAPAADLNPHPEISGDSEWARSLVILILGMFAAAALVGTVVKMPTLAPVAHDDHDHAHDDHGHGDHGHAPAHGH